MKMKTVSGAAMAAAAAGLFMAGSVVAPTQAAAKGMGHCMGMNACKGQSACKTASNSCKGQNACKGQGFTMASKSKCMKEGGKFEKA